MSELNPKQLKFCREYVKDYNGTQAAIRAGYSKRTAQEQSSQLLSKLIVKSKIDELTGKQAEKAEIDAQWIIEKFKNIHELGIKGKKKQLNAANTAIENIARHTGFYELDNKQQAGSLVELLKALKE